MNIMLTDHYDHLKVEDRIYLESSTGGGGGGLLPIGGGGQLTVADVGGDLQTHRPIWKCNSRLVEVSQT